MTDVNRCPDCDDWRARTLAAERSIEALEADLAFARQCIANADEVLSETAAERDAARARVSELEASTVADIEAVSEAEAEAVRIGAVLDDLVGAIRPLADRITALTLSPHAGHLWSELCRLDSDLRALINSNTGSEGPKGEGT